MLIDAHAHMDLFYPIGDEALQTAITEIQDHHIFLISNSMGLPSYWTNLEIASTCDRILPVFGVHPWKAPDYIDNLKDLIPAMRQSPMYGEIGLDYFFVDDPSAHPRQRQVLEFFLSAAREQNKLVTLHTKGAEKDVLTLLERHQITRGIVHWYSGPLDILQALVDRGLYFSVGVEVLYSDAIRAITRASPAGRLLTETDNPGGVRSFTTRPGSPVLLKDVIQGIAKARETTCDEIVSLVYNNLLELMRDDPCLKDVHDWLLSQGEDNGETGNGNSGT